MTNLHFHGLEVSPHAPQDDVLDMMAMPGETLHYAVQIPPDHPPGLYWYHTHPHGTSHGTRTRSGTWLIEAEYDLFPSITSPGLAVKRVPVVVPFHEDGCDTSTGPEGGRRNLHGIVQSLAGHGHHVQNVVLGCVW